MWVKLKFSSKRLHQTKSKIVEKLTFQTLQFKMFKFTSLHKNNNDMIKKLKVWLNNELNRSFFILCCNKILLYVHNRVSIHFLFLKYQNHFEFPRVVRSPHLKILGIPRGGEGGHQRPPGTEIFGDRECKSKSLPWGGMDIWFRTAHYMYIVVRVYFSHMPVIIFCSGFSSCPY